MIERLTNKLLKKAVGCYLYKEPNGHVGLLELDRVAGVGDQALAEAVLALVNEVHDAPKKVNI